MDTKQIEYILKIAEENNITRAAEKLYITQSALNQQLLKLEKELGTQLFHRSRTNWRPTEAGEVYIQNAKEMLRIKKETYDKISDIAEIKRGKLVIGFTAGRGIQFFTDVYPTFHQKYPQIYVETRERTVKELQKMIAEGEVDLAFLTLREKDKTKDAYVDILEEEIVVGIPDSHPLAEKAASEGDGYSTLDLKALEQEPFVVLGRESTMRGLFDQIFQSAGYRPNILFSAKNNYTITTMIRSKMCCGLVPYYYAKTDPEGIAFFRIPGNPTWKLMASCRRDSYLTEAGRFLIELAKDYWKDYGLIEVAELKDKAGR